MTPYQYGEPHPESGPGEAYGLSLSEYLAILLDDWQTVVAMFVASVVAAVIYLLVTVPTYQASGVIQVSAADASEASTIIDMVEGRPSPVETEVEILRSNHIVRRALQVLSLNIDQDAPVITFNFDITLEGKSPIPPELKVLRRMITHLEIADWHESPIPATFTVASNRGVHLRLRGGAPHFIPFGSTFSQQGVSFSFGKATLRVPKTQVDVSLLPNDIAVEQIKEKLSVTSVGGTRNDTNLARVTFESCDRAIARDVVNAVMDAYQSFALDWRTLSAEKSTVFIEKQIQAIETSIERTDREMEDFVARNGAVFLPEQAKELIETSASLDLEMRKTEIQAQLLRSAASGMERAEGRGEAFPLTSDFLFPDELLSKAVGTLNELELERETLVDVTKEHPGFLKLGQQIGQVRKQTSALIRSSLGRIKERRQALAQTMETIQEKLQDFPSKERQLAALRRNQEVEQQLHSLFLTKFEESRLIKESTTTDKRIIDRATTPFEYNRPRKRTTLLVAALLGVLLGVGAVFARRAIDPRVRDEEEAKTLWNLPLYGAIPDLQALGVVGRSQPVLEAIWQAPKGPAAESFRTVRTNVEFAQVGAQTIRVLQITSSEASEGKSTVIANLGVALAKAGHRVLVVDLDLRRPSQHRLFHVSRVPGISDHLVGRGDLPLHRIEPYGVDFIPAGNEPPESQRLLASNTLEALVAEWRSRYDYILLDTPPLLVADSIVLSRLSDMVLFVVRPKQCRRAILKVAKNAEKRMAQVKGLIVNGVATRRGGYYHYYRGSYYGSKTSDTQER